MNPERLLKYIQAEDRRQITSLQKKELKAWRKQADAHEQQYQQYCRLYHRAKELAVYNQIDADNAWKTLGAKAQRQRLWKKSIFHYSAAALIALGLLFSIFFHDTTVEAEPEQTASLIVSDHSAVITIETKHGIVEVEQLSEMEAIDLESAQAIKTHEQLILTDNHSEEETAELELNKLTVPRAKTYALTLTDGTTIQANADTKVIFPTSFKGEERRIWVEHGEIFLDVAHNAEKPFIVQVKGIDIRVTGTRFNVNAYNEQQEVAVTLEEGGIRVSTAESSNAIAVKPGQQFTHNFTTRESTLQSVDVSKYTAWTQGEYYFENESLENILTVLCRWYDYQVEFGNDECKAIQYSGRLRKKDDILTFLRALENLEEVQCRVDGRNLIFK